MKTILKKNQIIISVIAIMLIAAGYMNYTTNSKQALATGALADTEKYGDLGDATLVSANIAESSGNSENPENSENSINEVSAENTNTNEQAPNETISNNENNVVTTSTTTNENQYFAESRLEREKMYSQMLESYQKILSSNQISEAQKEISQNEIKNINDTKNAIMITENLLKNKGFEDLIIFINGESINIIIKTKELKEEQIAQIQNIVTRELKKDIEDIHISCKE